MYKNNQNSNSNHTPNKVSIGVIIFWSLSAFFIIGIIACASEYDIGGTIFYIILSSAFWVLGFLKYKKGVKRISKKAYVHYSQQVNQTPNVYQQNQLPTQTASQSSAI